MRFAHHRRQRGAVRSRPTMSTMRRRGRACVGEQAVTKSAGRSFLNDNLSQDDAHSVKCAINSYCRNSPSPTPSPRASPSPLLSTEGSCSGGWGLLLGHISVTHSANSARHYCIHTLLRSAPDNRLRRSWTLPLSTTAELSSSSSSSSGSISGSHGRGVKVSHFNETPTPGPVCFIWTFV